MDSPEYNTYDASGAIGDCDDGVDDYSFLFDMSTVMGRNDSAKTIIKSEIVKISRAVLKGNGIEYTEDSFLSFTEEAVIEKHKLLNSKSDNALNLSFSRGCGKDSRDTDHFVMPSLRLDYIDEKEYEEPTRDREKNWALDSQRHILNDANPEEVAEEKKRLVRCVYMCA
jgi:hypothetical protein